MAVPDTTQVPLYQSILNPDGSLPLVWVMFFQKLANLANHSDGNADLFEITQLAHQMPTNAQQAQDGKRIDELERVITPIVVHIDQAQQIPPVMSVSLCPEQCIAPISISLGCQQETTLIQLPTSEIIHA